MTDHDADDLPELDRRGEAAAAALRTRIDSLVADSPATDAGPIRLDRQPRTRKRPTRPRLLAAAAAVVLALALGAGAVALLTDDDDGAVVTGDGVPGYLVPKWLPENLQLMQAADLAGGEPDRAPGGDMAVYGDPDADDPFRSTLAVVHLVVGAEDGWEWDASDGETVTVAGHEAMLSPTDGPWDDTESESGWQVEWVIDDARLIVAGSGLARDQVLAAAEVATPEPSIEAAGLPEGYAEVARGPIDAASPTLFGSGHPSGLAVSYADPSEGDDQATFLGIVQRPAPESAVDLLRGSYPESDDVTVRGQRGVVGRGPGYLALQWAEPSGSLVTIFTAGVDEETLLRIAGGLRPADRDEIEDLLEASGEFGTVPEGHVEVATGETEAGKWRLLADTAAPEGGDALLLERVHGPSGGSVTISGSASGMVVGEGDEPPVLELMTDTEEGVTIVYGLVHPDAVSVGYEAPGIEGTLDVHEIDGWDRKVVAVDVSGALAVDSDAGRIGTVTLIARDAEGRELGRHQVALDPDTAWPEDEPLPDGVVEECTTLPDGSTECVDYETSGATDATVIG